VLAIDDDILDYAPCNVRHDLAQGLAWRGRQRPLADLPIDRPVRIGDDDQPVAEVGGRVLEAGLALGNGARQLGRPGEVNQFKIRGGEVSRLDDEEPVGEADAQRDGEALLHLFVDELVVGCRRAELVAIDFLAPLGGIAAHVEQPLTVERPHGAATHLGDLVGKVLARRQVADLQRVALRAVRVEGVG
jgi:hypothetical protein